MKKKIALIYGITGQDGSYLSRLLLKKNYQVIGVKRKASSFNTERIDDLYEKYKNKNQNKFETLKLFDVGLGNIKNLNKKIEEPSLY